MRRMVLVLHVDGDGRGWRAGCGGRRFVRVECGVGEVGVGGGGGVGGGDEHHAVAVAGLSVGVLLANLGGGGGYERADGVGRVRAIVLVQRPVEGERGDDDGVGERRVCVHRGQVEHSEAVLGHVDHAVGQRGRVVDLRHLET